MWSHSCNGYTSDCFFPFKECGRVAHFPLCFTFSPLPVLSLYADDTSINSTSDSSTMAVFEVYTKFEIGTGAKLNLGKCQGLWLGPWRNCHDSPVAISWNSVKIRLWESLLAMAILMRQIGAPGLMGLNVVSILGVLSPCRSLVKQLLSMHWRFLEFGMSPLLFLCLLGSAGSLIELFLILILWPATL